VCAFTVSDISSTTPPLTPFFPEAKNRNGNRFLVEFGNEDGLIPLLLQLLGNSVLHCFAPPYRKKKKK
jgi:hypothetical protein